jgi:hypothetical protein
MDPTACFQRALDAFDDGDYTEAQAACVDLAGWLAKGGHVPEIYPRDWMALVSIMEECAIRNQGD